MQQEFTGKVVIITGGGMGIGRCIAMRFAERKAMVVVADVDTEAGLEVESQQREKGLNATFIFCDVSNSSSVEAMVGKVKEMYGRVDILVNNAGIFASKVIDDADSIEIWDYIIGVNLSGMYRCSKHCSSMMKQEKTGCIINISSTRSLMSEPDTEAYSASKGGIVALTHAMAVSLGSSGIRVNCISPGWIDISSWKKTRELVQQPSLRPEDHAQHVVGRVGVPDDVANCCLYLASEASSFLTGQNIVLDGGMTIKMIYAD